MAHALETGAINWLYMYFFLAPVSGTCIMQIWHRIHLLPHSGAG